MHVNLKALQVFVSVAEAGSFRKAADIVHRSQSAVSMQIKQLEEQLGIVLFHRTTRRVELTPGGDLLLGCARRALGELDGGLRRIREAADMQTGRLSLGCVPSVAATVLPAVLSAYQRDFPGIRITLRELASDDLLQAIARHDVEFGVGPGVAWASDFAFRPIARDPIYALLPAAFDTTGRPEITLTELASLPVLMYSQQAALRGNLERELASRGLRFDIRFEILHAHTLVAFAQAGLGVAVLPLVTIPARLGPKLRAVPIVDPPLERSLDVITLRGQSLSPAAERLANLIAARFPRGAHGSTSRSRRTTN